MIHTIEEMFINADPSSDQFLEQNFLVRCFTNDHLCAIHALPAARELHYAEAVNEIAAHLVQKGLNPCYRIVEQGASERLDQELVRQSYGIVEEGVVLALRIENMERELFAFANFYEQGILIEESFNAVWLKDYQDLTQMDPTRAQFFSDNLRKSVQDHMYFGLFERDRLLGMGYVVFQGSYLIIKDIYIDERYRNLDYGKRILKAMLIKGLLRECTVALCEVGKKEQIAGRFFTSAGFEVVYGYHYRSKNLIDR